MTITVIPESYPSSIQGVKVSISLSDRQLEFVDQKVAQGAYASRSAAVAAAIRRLQERDLVLEYAQEQELRDAFGESGTWDSTLTDGLDDEAVWWE